MYKNTLRNKYLAGAFKNSNKLHRIRFKASKSTGQIDVCFYYSSNGRLMFPLQLLRYIMIMIHTNSY